jgi:hypothetical protein
MKLWSFTAKGLQRSKCGEVDLATREKMPIIIDSFLSNKCLSGSTAISRYLFDIAVIAESIGIFYE